MYILFFLLKLIIYLYIVINVAEKLVLHDIENQFGVADVVRTYYNTWAAAAAHSSNMMDRAPVTRQFS